MLLNNALDSIKVSDICKKAQINRTTFYSNYDDIYALADSIRAGLEAQIGEVYKDEISKKYNSNDFENKYIEYHCEFFRAAITSIIKMWLKNGCKESPAEMADIIRQEYRGRLEIVGSGDR